MGHFLAMFDWFGCAHVIQSIASLTAYYLVREHFEVLAHADCRDYDSNVL
jgi:hypothetical protein